MANKEVIFRAILDCLESPVFVLAPDLSCVFANKHFFSFFGLKPPSDGVVRVGDFWPDIAQANLSCSEISCELKLARGDIFTVKLALHSLPEHFRLVRVLAGLSKNETHHSFHAQRLETLGMLAGGVAHDFNNILTGILGHITYLKTILPAKGPHVESLLAVEDGAKKGSSITQQILSFSKLEVAEKLIGVPICGLIIRTCSLLRGAISPRYHLQSSVPEEELYVLGVEGRLAQVIVNLVINSRDAVEEDGHIHVWAKQISDQEQLRRVLGVDELPCKSYAVLCVEDDGHGMPKEILDRVFEPYFSTKKEKGTGLGLSTVAAIVRSFGGAVQFASAVGQGTQAYVYLPLVEPPQSAAEAETSVRQLETGSERILVVDDEYPVRNVLSVSLQHLGYQVETAQSGSDAIRKYSSSSAYDLVVLDMLMPQLSGEKVFFRLKELNPHVRVLIISGYASEDSVKNILTNGGLDFIQKPFTIEELSKRVRRCLDLEAGAAGH